MPTVDDIIYDLNSANFMSKLDLKNAYHQLELDDESRPITTFATHIGLFRYKRLFFGVNSAAEIFQKIIHQLLQAMPGTINVSDDILIHGQTRREHDARLQAVQQKLNDHGLTVNTDKCEFGKTTLDFYGLRFATGGISADPHKMKAISDAADPQNPSEVRSLLGMMNYSARFIPDYATITHPLRQLTHKNTPWEWTQAHTDAMGKLKALITKSPVLAYFDPGRHTEIVVDASPVGLGAILTQKAGQDGPAQVVAYASKALSPTQQRYSQLEREALAVLWGCQHFCLYVHGLPITVITDHKPLVHAFQKDVPSIRLEKWALQLQAYCPDIVYRPGKDNPADYLSRHPSNTANEDTRAMEAYVNLVSGTATPTAMTLESIQQASQADPTMRKLAHIMENGKWHQINDQEDDLNTTFLRQCAKVRDELARTQDGIILRGNKIVVPASLQQQAIRLAHTGHQGLVKTKQLLRTKVWFPGMDKLTEDRIRNCTACQAVTDERTHAPLHMTELPKGPWQKIAADFKGPLPNGKYMLVMIDLYSRFPMVEFVSSTSAAAVIPVFDKVFAEHGIPLSVVTDNGPPFNSQEFASCARTLGFRHRKITPAWPQANGEVERFMRTLNKVIQTATVENTPIRRAVVDFLRNHRATPHTTTGKPPAEMMFGRNIRVQLPEQPQGACGDSAIRQRDAAIKWKAKDTTDAQSKFPPVIRIGDCVLVKQRQHRKSAPRYDPEPYTVIHHKGTLLTAKRRGQEITRNISFFKRIPPRTHQNIPIGGNNDDDDVFIPAPQQQAGGNDTPEVPGLRRNPERVRHPPRYLQDFAQCTTCADSVT